MSDLKPLKLKSSAQPFFKKYKFIFLTLIIMGLVLFIVGRQSNSSVFQYAFGGGSLLKTENNRVNILLLGIGGGTHDGPNLTDTIMVVSYDTVTHTADLISLPRDLWIDSYKIKVNTLYQIGIDKQNLISGENKGNGLGLVKEELGKILGLEIPYAVRVDFNGFTQAVDRVGGIDVDVAKSFNDYVYPIKGKENEMCGYSEDQRDITEDQSKTLGVKPGKLKVLLDPQGQIATVSTEPQKDIVYTDDDVVKYFPCRFEHLIFQKGIMHMDGITALKFVRSRHGTNGEGSDFARSKRQQLVLQSFKEKALSLNTLIDPRKVIDLSKTLGASIDSDIPQNTYVEFIKLIKELKGTKSIIIDTSGDNPLLISPPPANYGGAWVLVPIGGDFSKIHQFITDTFTAESASESAKQAR